MKTLLQSSIGRSLFAGLSLQSQPSILRRTVASQTRTHQQNFYVDIIADPEDKYYEDRIGLIMK